MIWFCMMAHFLLKQEIREGVCRPAWPLLYQANTFKNLFIMPSWNLQFIAQYLWSFWNIFLQVRYLFQSIQGHCAFCRCFITQMSRLLVHGIHQGFVCLVPATVIKKNPLYISMYCIYTDLLWWNKQIAGIKQSKLLTESWGHWVALWLCFLHWWQFAWEPKHSQPQEETSLLSALPLPPHLCD